MNPGTVFRETRRHMLNAINISMSKVLAASAVGEFPNALLVLSRLDANRQLVEQQYAADIRFLKESKP